MDSLHTKGLKQEIEEEKAGKEELLDPCKASALKSQDSATHSLKGEEQGAAKRHKAEVV